jgi:hypothetical protein
VFNAVAKLCTTKLLQIVLLHLDHENWHVREELMSVLLICYLLFEKETEKSIDFLTTLASRLGDEKQKVA